MEKKWVSIDPETVIDATQVCAITSPFGELEKVIIVMIGGKVYEVTKDTDRIVNEILET